MGGSARLLYYAPKTAYDKAKKARVERPAAVEEMVAEVFRRMFLNPAPTTTATSLSFWGVVSWRWNLRRRRLRRPSLTCVVSTGLRRAAVSWTSA